MLGQIAVNGIIILIGGLYHNTEMHNWSSCESRSVRCKEGTTDTIIEYCTVDASGLSGQNFADSFMDIKGSRAFVRFNTFKRNGALALTKGIAIIDREVALSADQNVFHDNVFNFDNDSSIQMVEAGSRTTETIAVDNTKIPSAGSPYSGDVTETCCPDWYQRPTETSSTSKPVTLPIATPQPSLKPSPDLTPQAVSEALSQAIAKSHSEAVS
jgi:hypothetical protein